MLHAKATALGKDPTLPLEPLNYRSLMVMPTIYRKWALTRMKHLQPWIARWQLDDMLADIPGASAEDPWFTASLDLQHAHIKGQPAVGGGQ